MSFMLYVAAWFDPIINFKYDNISLKNIIQDIRFGCELCKEIDILVCTNMSSNVMVALTGVIS